MRKEAEKQECAEWMPGLIVKAPNVECQLFSLRDWEADQSLQLCLTKFASRVVPC